MQKREPGTATGQPGTLLLRRSDLSPLLSPQEYIDGIEYAFRQYGEGKTFGNSMGHGDTPSDLEFHIKAGGLLWKGKPYFAVKANGSTFQNQRLRGLPNILGVIVLYDGESGFPLAIMESTELTRQRTAAGTAVALKYLTPPGTQKILICGCGAQGRTHLRYLKETMPLDEVFVFDIQPEVGQAFAGQMTLESGIPVRFVPDIPSGTARSQVVVTCTPSRTPFLTARHTRPGMTVAAVGADSPVKQELKTDVFKGNKVIVDILSQCLVASEIGHAIRDGQFAEKDVFAELGEVVAGKRPGRENPDEIIIYKATGTAIQDTAAAVMVYEKALAKKAGTTIDFFGLKGV